MISSIEIRDQLVAHGWCSRLSTRFTSFNPDDIDYIEKIIATMISFIDDCRANFISLIPTLVKLKTNSNNIEILIKKLHQRSSDDL